MGTLIEDLIIEGENFTFENNCHQSLGENIGRVSTDYQAWIVKVEDFIIENYGINSPPYRWFNTFDVNNVNGFFHHGFESEHPKLLAALKACLQIKPKKRTDDLNKIILLNIIFEKFHSIVIQLRKRYNERSTLDVKDEYDVQDLLLCLLKLFFNDIRKEEWTPSYAGVSSRMDFLLKEEQIVIEVKKTRKTLTDKELGTQLIEDKEKYKQHPNCKKLICFTYDPEGRISNPKGLQNDLNKDDSDFKVEIIIKP